MPLLSRGDAAFHVATFENVSAVEEHVEAFENEFPDINQTAKE